MKEYTNSQITALIDEHVHNERYRRILKDRLVNGYTFDQLAEKHDVSVRQAKNIVYITLDRLLKYL